MAQLIFEIFGEEIPARMQLPAATRLKQEFDSKIKQAGLFTTKCKSFVTPRRLVLFADGLSLTQEDSVSERKGPRTDAPEQALNGFLKSTGLTRDQLTVKSTPKGDFFFAITRQKGRPTKEIIKEILQEILAEFYWPKSMRWGQNRLKWVRPISNIASVFGGEALEIEFGHLKSNNLSYGHRFLGPDSFEISDFEGYEKNLRKRSVILSNEERKEQILKQSKEIAKDNGLSLIYDEKLLDEVTGLVEFPKVLFGSINKSFLQLPEEVLITSIKTHQKYFCLRDGKGKLSPYFVFVSNMQTADGNSKIIEGNERVLKARLSDGEFFYQIDKEKGLENFATKLDRVIFHAKVGTISERVKRIEKLTEDIAKQLAKAKIEESITAARLCKADLVTEMVGEFPELQGLMGYYYAMEDRLGNDIAVAIRDHYKPLGPNDDIPAKGVSSTLAIAEKVEGLASLFAAGERATGSKDPFALRRLSLGIIRILLENNITIEIEPLIKKSLKLLPSKIFKEKDRDEVKEEISEFILERLKHFLKSKDYDHNVINAALSERENLNIYMLAVKTDALTKFIGEKSGFEAVEAYNRASNILEIAEKKEKTKFSPKPSKSILEGEEEKALIEALDSISAKIKKFNENKISEKLDLLAKLTGYINAFYDNTMINAEDKKIRDNRLKISSYVKSVFESVTSFEALE